MNDQLFISNCIIIRAKLFPLQTYFAQYQFLAIQSQGANATTSIIVSKDFQPGTNKGFTIIKFKYQLSLFYEVIRRTIVRQSNCLMIYICQNNSFP